MGPDVGTEVHPEFRSQAEDPSVGVAGDGTEVALLPRVVGRDQMFLPILDPHDRPRHLTRRPHRQDILGVELTPNPEPSPDGILHEQQPIRIEVQQAGHGRPVPVGYLGRTVHP